MKNKNIYRLIKFFSLTLFFVFFLPYNTSASTTEINRLNEQIDQKRNELQEIDREIERQKQAIQATSGRANTLQNTLQQLEASRRKLLTDISRTETRILEAELTIEKLSLEILEKDKFIKHSSKTIAESIRRMNQYESISAVERILGYQSISDFWMNLEQDYIFQDRVRNEINSLIKAKQDLELREQEKEIEKKELATFRVELSSERQSVEHTRNQQAELLQRTKNEEAEYQRILAENLRRKQAFENDLLEIESKLKILIDPKSYPAARSGIISWPLDNIRITQMFGGSQFAQTNPHIYGRPFHPGTDFAAPIGTRVKSVYNGKVIALGNTDDYPGCYAWGRWILVEHTNGLSSLYAHLSSISVTVGQQVTTGQVIGLSGNTGVTTGPHLHLTLYASQGVKVGKYGDYRPGGTGCAATNATGPFADLNAYLDPIQYLPKQ
ncbi:MAG TPA: peptidoglycan DD-metalloendopeptidase family protein [Candidatus Paceibacterota bacterium]|nr:peptidoglycan DD-metalloendopeptidase family protein [Candidatus Paceibacterota bacterium]